MAFKATIDDPGRFRRSSDVGAHLGQTPRQYQSGETGVRGRISRSGDAFTRTALFTAAHVMLTRSRQWTSIRAWGLRIAKRSSLKKAKIAVARKLAVVLHRMWRDDAPFRWGAAAWSDPEALAPVRPGLWQGSHQGRGSGEGRTYAWRCFCAQSRKPAD
ncbi:transposase [Leisingera sp. NJS204]|uniref:transposase n=1 Tax=Leisingera sp. NJS204 TaxID=2508307 RepID=UPI0034A0BBD8